MWKAGLPEVNYENYYLIQTKDYGFDHPALMYWCDDIQDGPLRGIGLVPAEDVLMDPIMLDQKGNYQTEAEEYIYFTIPHPRTIEDITDGFLE